MSIVRIKKVPDRELMLFANFLILTDNVVLHNGKSIVGDLMNYELYKEINKVKDGKPYSPEKAERINNFLKKYSNTIGFEWKKWKEKERV